jgi:hypothetical protein
MLYTVFAPVVVSARIAAFCGEHSSHWALFIVIFKGRRVCCAVFSSYTRICQVFFKRFIALPINHRAGATLEKFFAIFLFLYMQRLWTFTSARDIKEGQKTNGQSKRGEGEEKYVQKEILCGRGNRAVRLVRKRKKGTRKRYKERKGTG